MKLNELRVGSEVEIHIKRGGYSYKIFRHVEYTDDKRIAVLPIVKNEEFEFLPSDRVEIIFQKDTKSYRWSKVVPSMLTPRFGKKLHSFESRDQAVVVNRRTSYRVEIKRKIKIKYEFSENSQNAAKEKGPASISGIQKAFSEPVKHEQAQECQGFLVDLSEGGASISAPCELNKGDMISFSIPYGKAMVFARGVVVRIQPTPLNRVYPINYGIAYTETSSNYVSYLYAEQRQLIASKNKE